MKKEIVTESKTKQQSSLKKEDRIESIKKCAPIVISLLALWFSYGANNLANNANNISQQANVLATEANEISKFNINTADIKLSRLDEYLDIQKEKEKNNECQIINIQLAEKNRNMASELLINGNFTPEEILSFKNYINESYKYGRCTTTEAMASYSSLILVIIILSIIIIFFTKFKRKMKQGE